MKTLRIFISSPGDVAYERSLATEILNRVAKEFEARLVVEPYFWEHEPYELTRSFQHQIPTPGADLEVNYDLMVCFLWSRLGSRLHGSLKLPDGSEAKSGTQFEVEWALHAKRISGAPEVYLWLNRSEPVIPLEPVAEHDLRFGQYQALKEFITRLTTEEGTFVGAFNDYRNLGEFEELFETKLRKILTRHAANIPAADRPSPQRPNWTNGSPFRGLHPFEREHAPVFFGRTSAIGESLALLRKRLSGGVAETGEVSPENPGSSPGNPPRGFQLILGASGVGKSSLARAGLIPALTTPGVIDGAVLWRTAIVKPSDAWGRLFEGLAAALLAPGAFPELAGDGTDLASLAARLADQPGRVVEAILGALREAAKDLMRNQRSAADNQAREFDASGRPNDARMLRERAANRRPSKAMGLLLVDQLEELFTRSSDRQQRSRFVETLRHLAESGRVVVLATMRSDFYGRIAEETVLADLASGNGTILLKPATANELGQVIRLPAAAAGLAFESNAEGKSLDEELRDKASTDPQILPLLEFALDRLYEQRDSHLLTWQSYRDMGGLEGALANHAENAIDSLENDQQRKCLNAVFGKLVALSVGDDEVPVRRVATMEDLAAAPEGEGELPGARAFVERFIERRLLVASRDEHSGMVTYAIAHEALLKSWEKLRSLIKDHAEFLRIRERAERRLHDWQNQGQDKSLLLPEGLAVNELEHLLRKAPELATPALGEYCNLSLAAIHRRKRRANRIRNGVLAVLTVLLALAAWQWRKAEETSRTLKTLSISESKAKEGYKRASTFMLEDFFTAARKLGRSDILDSTVRFLSSADGPIRPDSEPAAWLRLRLCQAEVVLDQGRVSESISLLEDALHTVPEQSDDLELGRMQLLARISLVDLYSRTRDLAKGFTAAERAETQLRTIGNSSPPYAKERLRIYTADLQYNEADLDKATRLLKESIEAIRGNSEELSVAGFQAHLDALTRLIRINIAGEDLGQAEKFISEKLAVLKSARFLHAAELVRWKREEGSANSNLAHLLAQQSRFDEALEITDSYLDDFQQLRQRDPLNLNWQHYVGLAQSLRGRILFLSTCNQSNSESHSDKLTEASGLFASAAEIFDMLCSTTPENVDWKRGLLLNQSYIADLALELPAPDGGPTVFMRIQQQVLHGRRALLPPAIGDAQSIDLLSDYLTSIASLASFMLECANTTGAWSLLTSPEMESLLFGDTPPSGSLATQLALCISLRTRALSDQPSNVRPLARKHLTGLLMVWRQHRTPSITAILHETIGILQRSNILRENQARRGVLMVENNDYDSLSQWIAEVTQ